MIYLTKGQKLFNNEGMVVCDPTGYYEDGATVICAMFHSVDEPVCGYEAKYIAYGDQVYNITDEKALMEEIKKIDPKTLLGKTKEDVTIDNLVQEIKTVENPTPELTQDAVDANNENIDNAETSNTDVVEEETVEETDTSSDSSETVTEEDTTTDTTTDDTTDTTVDDATTDTTTETTTDATTPDVTVPDTTTTSPDIAVPPEVTTDQPVSILTGKNKRRVV